ncbi:MAG: aminoacyl-tRNA hydrolase [Kordiimonadaceae bacterium]|nr:aminoacyl-tRNA hydrolase [Kordiimonadaceae bacterium]
MLLFVGLGNPGNKYENHRHNVGFMAVDEIVRRHNFLPGKKRWQSLTHEGRLGSEKIIVVKPQTFMNESGRAIGEAMRFFKLDPSQVIVFYDELDLAFGKVKVKTGGGAAGHNGIRSITAHIGADFTRVRIGIDHPGDKDRVHSHVLGDFAKCEMPELDKTLDAIARECGYLAKEDTPRFLSQIALHLSPQRESTGTQKQNQKPEALQAGKKPGTAPVKQEHNEGPLAAALKVLKSGDK